MLNSILYYGLIFVVTGIPFYFQYRIESLPKTSESLDEINRLTARLTGLVLFLLFAQNFIATRSETKLGLGACIFSCLLLFWFRGKHVNEIMKIEVSPSSRLYQTFRALIGYTLIYGFYFTTVKFLIPQVGTLPSITITLIALNYLSPLLIRLWMPSSRMYPSLIKEEIQNILSSAGNSVGEIYLIDSDRFKSYNALVCGPKWGFGPFRRSLFITKSLFEVLEPDEIKAVICHEATHFRLNHIFKRGLLSLSGFVLSVFFILFPVFCVLQLIHPTLNTNPGVLAMISLITLMFQFLFIFRVIRKQEFEADLGALEIGANPISLSSALEKISRLSGVSEKKEDFFTRLMMGSGHPHWRERVNAIVNRKMPEDSKILPPWHYTVSYASLVLALGALTYMQDAQRIARQGDRSIASTPSTSTASTPVTETRQNLPTPVNQFNPDPESTDR